MATNEAGSSIGLTASLAERQPLVIDLDSEIVMKRCTMGSALAVVVNPKVKASPQQAGGSPATGSGQAGSKQRDAYYVKSASCKL